MAPDFLAHLRSDSQRFIEVLREADPDVPVPTCPDWRTDDLLWHLAEVQWFWGTVVADRLQNVDGLQAPDRPGSRADLVAFYEEHSARLHDELAAADPTTPVYMWADDRTVGYIRRRQAHEALIHRLDAELTAGEVTALDADLASDGVDEALRIMFGGCPPWGIFTPSGTQVDVVAADTGLVVPVALGRFTGTDPAGGTSYDEDAISVTAVDPGRAAVASIRGSAADLDTWLWHRRDDASLTIEGDRAALDRFITVLAQPID